MNPGNKRSLLSVNIALFTIFALCFNAICQTRNIFERKVSSAEITGSEPNDVPDNPNASQLTPESIAAELITNGGFETGNFNGWTRSPISSNPFRYWAVTQANFGGDYQGVSKTAPRFGLYDAWNGFCCNSLPEFLYQDITIPAGNAATLTWSDKIQSNLVEFCTAASCGSNTYQVQIVNPTTGVVLQTLYSFTATYGTFWNTGWIDHSADISIYAGQTIRVRFYQTYTSTLTDNWNGPGQAEIDGVSVQTAPVTGTFVFSSTNYSINENAGSAIITVNRTGGSAGVATVNYATSNATAAAGQDYTATSGTLTFLNGETTKTFSVPITNDNFAESDETINLTLSNPSLGTSLGSPSTAVLTIIDQDGQDPPVDFDGDGKTDVAVVSSGAIVTLTSTPLNEVLEQGINNAGRVRTIKPIGADILTDERQRIWTHDYQKLLHFRAGRGFVELPKDVQAALHQWGVNSNRTQTEVGAAPITWSIRRSSDGSTFNTTFGTTDDILVPADYDGDNRADIAVWNGTQFRVLTSSSNYATEVDYTLGGPGSDPTVVGDYDGDGRDDPAVYDSTTGLWSWLGGATHTTLQSQTWMQGGIPAPGDYNGDGTFDFAVQVPPVASPDNAKFRIAFNDGSVGPAADLPVVYGMAVFEIVPGDYDGDGITDIAQVNLLGTDITWRVLLSSSNFSTNVRTDFGLVATDKTVQGDYDGDGKVDLAVYRPAVSPGQGEFRILQSSNGATVTINWGGAGDNPVGFFNTH